MKLSVCMIVKNEERFLADCLSSVQGIADQIVVLDTGSTDGTVEIAKKFKAEVHSFEWQDDFAAARNASIEYAKGDWILWLDADERLSEESQKLLPSLLVKDKRPIAYRVEIQNLLADGINYKISHAHRLFRNGQGIRFSGRIHEQIAPSVSRLGGEERTCGLRLLHLGYGLQGEDLKLKNQRNRKLLERMVRENPDDAYAHYTLAQHYGITGEPEKATGHYEIALSKNQFSPKMTGSLLNVMAENYLTLGQTEKARRCCQRSIRLIPEQVGAFYLLYRIEEQLGNRDQAEMRLAELKKQNARMKGKVKKIATDILLSDTFLARLSVQLLFNQQKYNSVCETYNALPPDERDDTALLEMYSESCLKLGRWQEAQKVLETLSARYPQNRYLKALGTVYIKRQEFEKAIGIYDSLRSTDQSDPEIIRRLAGLYAKTGRSEKAYALLNQLNAG